MSTKTGIDTYKRLLSYLKPLKGRIILAACSMLIYTMAHSLVSLTVFLVLNGMQNKSEIVIQNMPWMSWIKNINFLNIDLSIISFPTRYIPFVVVGVFLLRGIFDYMSNYQVAAVGLRAIRQVRDDLYSHLVQLSMSFYAKGRTGELMSRTINDVAYIQSGITDVLVDLFKQPLVILFNIPFVFFWGGPVSLIALIVFPLSIWPVFMLGKRLRHVQRKIQEQIADINSTMQETFTGMSVVKAYNMENYEIRKFTGINKRVNDFLKKTVRLTLVQRPLIEVMGAVGIAFSIWYGSKVLPLDRFAAFMACLFLFYDPLKRISKVNSTIQSSIAAGQRIFEMKDVDSEIINKTEGVHRGNDIQAIEYADISFSYEPTKKVLQHINVKVKHGEVIAIVGTSGSGKTTMMNLLLRFYEAQEGRILINGIDIRDYDIHSVRDKIGVVSQETFLFNTSVFENIAYGRLKASLEEVKEAARAAYADDFIKTLPKGYGTVIGERGVQLSGGQRQRLAIARAVLQNPPILILDEATSHLDTESERQVQVAVEHLMQGRTAFVIAHRLSTIQRSDRILVFYKGLMVQSGTNEALLKEAGIYKRLYDLQFS